MKIKVKYIDNYIDVNNGSISTVEIENKKYFYRFVNDLYLLLNNNDYDQIVFLDNDGNEINISNKIRIFVNYFDLGFESKKYINDISKYINDTISEVDKDKLNTEYQKVLKIYTKILNEIDIPLEIEHEININDITKLMKIKINYKNELLDNLLILIDIEKVISSSDLLIFINLKEYLSKAELEELYKYAIYNDKKILLIDSKSYGTTLNYENKLIIDENLEEIVLK